MRDTETRWGVLRNDTFNLDDVIQSLAALPHLPRVDVTVDRDNPAVQPDMTRVIYNGWFCRRHGLWPPDSSNIKPLLISVHLSDHDGSSYEAFLSERSREFMTEYGPVGCRDLATLDLLQSANVPAYFSGCLTLTFPRTEQARTEGIVFVDMPRLALDRVPKRVADSARYLSQSTTRVRGLSWSNRLRLGGVHQYLAAAHRLNLYRKAQLVVTTRLHAALPAAAMGTPTILVMPDPDDARFSGLKDLLTSISLDEFCDDSHAIDWQMSSTPTRHTFLAEHLRRACREFVMGPP